MKILIYASIYIYRYIYIIVNFFFVFSQPCKQKVILNTKLQVQWIYLYTKYSYTKPSWEYYHFRQISSVY